MEKDRRIMALDVGDARIGIAVSDPLLSFAQPLSTVNVSSRTVSEIIDIVIEKQCSTIVVGLPYELSGEEGAQAVKVRSFVQRLEKGLKKVIKSQEIELVYWDERLTSVQADRVISGSKLKNRERRAALDRVSAALILEAYLGARHLRGLSQCQDAEKK